MAGRIGAWLGGGLGNRLPVLLSAVRLADIYGRKLHVTWIEQAEMLLKLADLFDLDACPFLPENPNLVSCRYRTFPVKDAGGNQIGPSRVLDLPSDTFMVVLGHQFIGHHKDERSRNGDIRDPFMAELGYYFNQIPLNRSVQRRVEEISASLDFSRTLGVHIRRAASNSYYSDMDNGRDNWQVDWYIRSIEIILKQCPHLTRIYIASNRESVVEYVRAKFGDMVIWNDRAGDGWASLDLQREAIVELLILSRCAAILRQPGTTFSLFASVLRCAPMITLQNVDSTTHEPILEWSFLKVRDPI